MKPCFFVSTFLGFPRKVSSSRQRKYFVLFHHHKIALIEVLYTVQWYPVRRQQVEFLNTKLSSTKSSRQTDLVHNVCPNKVLNITLYTILIRADFSLLFF